MVSVFLSHSSKDKPFVRKLTDHLEQDRQIKAWLDDREIGPGANIVNEENETTGALIPGGAASVLVTTRQPSLRFLRLQPALPLES